MWGRLGSTGRANGYVCNELRIWDWTVDRITSEPLFIFARLRMYIPSSENYREVDWNLERDQEIEERSLLLS